MKKKAKKIKPVPVFLKIQKSYPASSLSPSEYQEILGNLPFLQKKKVNR